MFWNAVYNLVERLKKKVMGMKEYMEGSAMVLEIWRVKRFLDFGDAMDMTVCGTQFKKDDNKIKYSTTTYSLGGSNTMVDYLMICKQDRKCLWDVKAIPGEEAVSQHHLILADMNVRDAVKAQRKKFQPRRKVWRLNDENVQKQFQDKLVLKEAGEGDVNVVWEETRDCLLNAAILNTEICVQDSKADDKGKAGYG